MAKTRATAVAEAVATAIVAAALVAFLAWAFLQAADMPEVHVSSAAGECVRVIDFRAKDEGRESEYSCGRLPDRYDRVWVR